MQTHFKQYHRALVALAAVLLFVHGCKSNSTSTSDPSPIKPVSPRVGSSFLYYALTIDSTGAVTKVDSSRLLGDTVLATGLTQFGRTNVTQYTPNFLFQFVNYDSSGNIEYYMPPAGGQTGAWILVPLDSFGTHGSVEPNPDSSAWYTYTGQQQLTLANQQFNTESFDVFAGVTPDGIQGITGKEWYDTTTGVLLLNKVLAQRDSAGQYGTGSGYEIAKFSLK